MIRAAFNDGQFPERLRAGELSTTLWSENHPRRPPTGDPRCTLSQIWVYFDGGNPVALVHQYLRPDGKLGAGGRPDPKRLAIGDKVLAVRATTTV